MMGNFASAYDMYVCANNYVKADGKSAGAFIKGKLRRAHTFLTDRIYY